ncbi:MAG: amidohydrolase [Pseudomonadota bacterium]
MRTLLTPFLLAPLLLPLGACEQPAAPTEADAAADLILYNARVYTLAWEDPSGEGLPAPGAPRDDAGWHPDAQAVAIRGDRITYVGDTEHALTLADDDTQRIDLQGTTLLPGLVDSHTHVFNLGAALSRVNLRDVASEAEAVALVAERAAQVPEGEWIIGQGWDEGAWADRYPDKRLLSEAVPTHPVFMRSLHSFAGWVNQAALDRLEITGRTEVPSGGEMRLGADGEPTGLFLNRAVPLVEDAIPPASRAERTRQVMEAMCQMAQDGYVTVHDAGINGEELQILEQLEADGRLPLRVYAMLSAREKPLSREWLAKGPQTLTAPDQRLAVRSIKAFYDGALGSRGARLLQDYADRPGHRGVSGSQYGFDEALVEDLMRAGFQVGVHAIGDAGNRETLNFFQRVIESSPVAAQGRHRIEHAQVLHPQDLPRLAELGIIASMEPPHAVEDKTWAETRLGPQRIRGAYAWRSLRESGAQLVFNADNPGSDHNIFYGLHAAVTRRDKNRQPPEGWYPEEAVTMDEALRAYSRWAAYASFREAQTGLLAEGRWADLTALTIDPFVVADTAPGDLLEGGIRLTVVGGEVTYDSTVQSAGNCGAPAR